MDFKNFTKKAVSIFMHIAWKFFLQSMLWRLETNLYLSNSISMFIQTWKSIIKFIILVLHKYSISFTCLKSSKICMLNCSSDLASTTQRLKQQLAQRLEDCSISVLMSEVQIDLFGLIKFGFSIVIMYKLKWQLASGLTFFRSSSYSVAPAPLVSSSLYEKIYSWWRNLLDIDGELRSSSVWILYSF